LGYHWLFQKSKPGLLVDTSRKLDYEPVASLLLRRKAVISSDASSSRPPLLVGRLQSVRLRAKSTSATHVHRFLAFCILDRKQQTCLRSIGDLVTAHFRQPASNKLNNSLHTFENARDPTNARRSVVPTLCQRIRIITVVLTIIPLRCATALPTPNTTSPPPLRLWRPINEAPRRQQRRSRRNTT
jgi:hypothetical protein